MVRQEGFTLVEAAIVLVIVGLLAGAFLQGREMIAQGKVKRVVAEFSGVEAAYNSYLDRYRALPGDDPRADTRWAGIQKGDGDGVVSGRYDAASAAAESRLWWDHLRRAGLILGSTARQPYNALARLIGVQFGDAEGAPALDGFRLMLCSSGLPDKIARAVDAQLDDGAGRTGQLRAVAQGTPNPRIDAQTVVVAYVENGTNVYTVCRSLE